MNITFKSIRITFANLAEMQELLLFVQKMNIKLIPEFDENGQIIKEKKYPATLQKLINEKENLNKHIDLKPEHTLPAHQHKDIQKVKREMTFYDKKCIICGKNFTPTGPRQVTCSALCKQLKKDGIKG